MKRKFLQTLMLTALIALSQIAAAAIVPVPAGSITTNTSWTNDNTYVLGGEVLIQNATLTIQAGTLVKGTAGTISRIVVTKGAKIVAQGTPTQPIVFTSSQPTNQRKRGDWAGIIICGQAPVNSPTQLVAECGTSPNYDYGGNNADDSSGVLSYVRIEYAGYVCNSGGTELNSLTLCAVGRKTKIDHVQVSYGQDDGFEMFGGTVNLDHIISFGSRDDDFDTDFGWSGKAQYGLIVRIDSIVDQADPGNAFESDNDAGGSDNTPLTQGVISNFTVVGPAPTQGSAVDPQFGWCARLRRNTSQSIFNSVFIGYKRGLRIEGDSARAHALAGDLAFRYNVIAGLTQGYGEAGFDSTYLNNAANYNKIYTGNANDSVKLVYPYGDPNQFNFTPQAGSPLLAGADFTNSKLASFETTTFRGGFGNDNWTGCWAEFTPNDEAYSANPVNYGYAVTVSQTGTIPGTATLNVTVPAGAYTYNWSTSGATQSITVTNAGAYAVTVTNARGCTATATLTVVNTGVEEVRSNINSLSLFPNPTKNIATLETSLTEAADLNIAVTDMTGKVMMNKTEQLNSGVNQTIINTADYANGIYLVRIMNGAENQTIRLVVSK